MTNRRKALLIDSPAQLRFAGRVALYWCSAMLLLILVLVCFRTASIPQMTAGQHLAAALREQAPALAILVLILPLAVFDCIRFSNRYRGPIHRLSRDLSRIRQGEDIQIRFRQDDLLPEIPESINALVARIDDLEMRVARELEQDSNVV